MSKSQLNQNEKEDQKTFRNQQEQKLSPKDQIYISENEKTFQNDDKLPSLPVADLKQTLNKYLDTVRPLVTEEQFAETEKLVRESENELGLLYKKLVEKAKNERNWLEKWWEEYAYLRQRSPLIPYSNMSAPLPQLDFWPSQIGSRVERIALSLHYQLQFWKLIRTQKMRPMVHKGIPWSMDQFRKLWNTVRVPGESIDNLICNFKLESEGPPANTNIIVLYRGYIFSFNPIDLGEEEPLTPEEIAYQLYYIEKWCRAQSAEGPGIGALTTTDRTVWAHNRQYLKNLHFDNETSLNTIENSLMCIAFDDGEPLNQQEILFESMTGDCTNRWADKAMTTIAFNNGFFGANADHTPFDGLATSILTHYLVMSINECKGKWKGVNRFRDMPKPELVDFHLDDKIFNEIAKAKAEFRKNCEDIELVHVVFEDYGKSILVTHKFHPEAYIQIGLQLAYYRMHGRPAPTYCTASTRQFYHGRTETCRSCFPESVEFAKAVVQGRSSPGELYLLLQKAVKKFQHLMTDAMNNEGCDRLMLGLYLVSVEEGLEMPALFTDKAFFESGGGGNYILSTSCAGYWSICGGVPPMREDGYGTFYGIENNRITFVVISFKRCIETNPHAFYNNIKISLQDMQNILNASKL